MDKLIIIFFVITFFCKNNLFINSEEEIYHPRRHNKRNIEQLEKMPQQYLMDDKKYDCPKCQQNKQIERLTETELTDLRIQFVKNQILRKLRLTEKPQVVQRDIPKPVVDGATILEPNHDDNTINRMFDDYYGTTTQKIIFLKEEKKQCKGIISDEPSKCFSFQIPGDVEEADVNLAVLWMYKLPDLNDNHNLTFIVTEVSHWDTKKSFLKSNPIAIRSTNETEGWMKIDLAWAVKNWFQYHELTHVIHVSCKNCEMDATQSPFDIGEIHKPFIVIDTSTRSKGKRKRRSVNCSAGVTECCREKLYISFADIGWDDWILQPPGYHAYFCRGSCTSAATITLSGSHYNSVLRKIMNKKNAANEKNELIPCCTATRFSSLQLFYMDSNNTATQKTLPNMVVENCGCM